mmetsp:Transcript_14730/g.24558  ORF Transcript_14730/g.24558 Transcript_14730/m.24558 type:complete len:245 (+) Transcript_14730:755-1489(+)
MTVDLDNFVERMSRVQKIFDICMDYEDMWVRLHSEGLDRGPKLHQPPDILHERISHLSLRIAHHIAAAADRLVLAQWSGGLTGKKPPINSQQKLSIATHVSDGPLLIEKRSKLSSDTNQNWAAGVDVLPELILDQTKALRESGFDPTPDLIAHIREELFQNDLSIVDGCPCHSNTLLSCGILGDFQSFYGRTIRFLLIRSIQCIGLLRVSTEALYLTYHLPPVLRGAYLKHTNNRCWCWMYYQE